MGDRCDAPARYGGMSATRKFSKSELGVMWRCNRITKYGGRCWQHPDDPTPSTPTPEEPK